MTDRTFKAYKKSLNQFATTYALIVREIEGTSTRRLNYYLKHGTKLDTGNCWWATYQVFPLLQSLILEELNRRSYAKKKKNDSR